MNVAYNGQDALVLVTPLRPRHADRGRATLPKRQSTSVVQVQLKLVLRPAQERLLVRWLRHLTAVYNWTLRKIELDAADGRRNSPYGIKKLLNGHSKRLGISVYALGGTVDTAFLAWDRCFNGIARKPRLKGRRRRLSSIAFDHWYGRPSGTHVLVSGVGRVRFHKQDCPEGHISCARVVKRASGWYLCLFVRVEPKPIDVVTSGEVGIDPGFESLLTLSSGEKVEHPHEWRRHEKRVGQAQKGNRKRLVARLQERIGNRRRNRNHHLSRRLVAANRLIAFSVDRSNAIARRFGKSVTSAAHGQLRQMLAYKSRAGGRQFIEVPSKNSTKRCSACGALSGPSGLATLKVRQWTCTGCGAHHDRDVNAAMNTLIAGRGMRHERASDGSPEIAACARRRSPRGSAAPTETISISES